MHHKYHSRSIVLTRYPAGEDSATVALLTADFGLVRARAQGVRKYGAKNAAALQTLAQSDVGLIRGKEAWRVAGAVLEEPWFSELSRPARLRAGRITALLLRLVRGEEPDPALYAVFSSFLTALRERAEPLHDAAEFVTALRILRILGLDAGELPGGSEMVPLSEGLLEAAVADRSALIARVNRGLAASDL